MENIIARWTFVVKISNKEKQKTWIFTKGNDANQSDQEANSPKSYPSIPLSLDYGEGFHSRFESKCRL